MFTFLKLLFISSILFTLHSAVACQPVASVAIQDTGYATPTGNCATFTLPENQDCNWMCNYCTNALGTTGYFFETGVCQQTPTGCIGNPYYGVVYTCCIRNTVYSPRQVKTY